MDINSNYLLPLPIVLWCYFYFKERQTPLFITSLVLLFMDIRFMQLLPDIIQYFLFFKDPLLWLLNAIAFILGVWGVFRQVFDIPTILKGERVVETWAMIVEQAAGRDQWYLNEVEKYIKEARMPSVDYVQKYVATRPFGEQRKLLVVTHLRYREYKMYISARNFGAHLDIAWYLTIEPRFLKRMLSKYAMGNPQALSQEVDAFDQQDLRAYITVVHHIVKRVVDILLDELKQDPTPMGLNSASKGFLSVW